MSLHIRKAQTDDALGIATVHVGSWQAVYDGLLPRDYLAGLSIDESARIWTSRLQDQLHPATTLVADRDGVLVGFTSVAPSRDDDAGGLTGELRAIYVAPDRWRQGIGSALHPAALATLVDQGFRSATLWVLTSNSSARAFYVGHGWQPDMVDKVDHRSGLTLKETRYRLSLHGLTERQQ